MSWKPGIQVSEKDKKVSWLTSGDVGDVKLFIRQHSLRWKAAVTLWSFQPPSNSITCDQRFCHCLPLGEQWWQQWILFHLILTSSNTNIIDTQITVLVSVNCVYRVSHKKDPFKICDALRCTWFRTIATLNSWMCSDMFNVICSVFSDCAKPGASNRASQILKRIFFWDTL